MRKFSIIFLFIFSSLIGKTQDLDSVFISKDCIESFFVQFEELKDTLPKHKQWQNCHISELKIRESFILIPVLNYEHVFLGNYSCSLSEVLIVFLETNENIGSIRLCKDGIIAFRFSDYKFGYSSVPTQIENSYSYISQDCYRSIPLDSLSVKKDKIFLINHVDKSKIYLNVNKKNSLICEY